MTDTRQMTHEQVRAAVVEIRQGLDSLLRGNPDGEAMIRLGLARLEAACDWMPRGFTA